METLNKTPTEERKQITNNDAQTNCETNVHEQRCNLITCAIVKLRLKMREHAMYKTLNTRDELNWIYKQLEKLLEL